MSFNDVDMAKPKGLKKFFKNLIYNIYVIFLVILKIIYLIGDFVQTTGTQFVFYLGQVVEVYVSLFFRVFKSAVKFIYKEIVDYLHEHNYINRFFTKTLQILTGFRENDIDLRTFRYEKKRYGKAIASKLSNYFTPVLSLLLLVLIVRSAMNYTIGVKVFIDGSEVAVLQNEDSYLDVVKEVEEKVETVTGKAYILKASPVFNIAVVNKNGFKNDQLLIDKLVSKTNDAAVSAYGLYINDIFIGSTANKNTINDVLNNILEKSKPNKSYKASFTQTITIKKDIYPRNRFYTKDALAYKLSLKSSEATDYRVNENDTFSSIAKKLKTDEQTLQALNPHVETLKEGLSIAADGQLPRLQIKLVGTETFKQSIAYKTIKIPTDDLYSGNTRVKSEGIPGEQTITAQVTRIDGQIVSKKTLKTSVTKEPTPRYLYVGTRARPKTLPTGSLRWPTTGIISSGYGYRGWGEFHPAIDIANRVGTPIYAADGGTVTFAKYSGSYGYLVKISHGGGIETWYAHQSKLLVSAGDKVYKGQQIGRMGSTGRSTGPHLHFEVRINGNSVNPLSYLPRR